MILCYRICVACTNNTWRVMCDPRCFNLAQSSCLPTAAFDLNQTYVAVFTIETSTLEWVSCLTIKSNILTLNPRKGYNKLCKNTVSVCLNWSEWSHHFKDKQFLLPQDAFNVVKKSQKPLKYGIWVQVFKNPKIWIWINEF